MDSVLQAGVVSAPLQVLIDRFATFTVRETGLLLAADDEFWKLRRTLERIRAMVGRVEENRSFFSNSSSSEAWKMWLQDVESLSYSADDLLDGISLDVAKRTANLSTNVDSDRNREVRNTILSSFKLTLPHQVTSIWQKLEDIAREMDALYKTEFTELGSRPSSVLKRGLANNGYSSARSSLVDEGSVIGRETEKNKIVDMLLDENLSSNKVSVVSIIGMGGIGKTTLAQLVYNDDLLVELGKFEKKMWVSVSMDFDTIRITKSIIESASGKRCKLSDLDPVQVELQDLIRGKKFLLVLDDYWSEEYKDWDLLSSPFSVGAQGSKILLTTRSRIVTRIVGTVRLHSVESLTDEESWEVVRQRAASNRNLTWELEKIGREVARKCRGLPLAAKTLGGMLQFKDDPREWMYVLNSELWDLNSDSNGIFPALALSYYHLPMHLKKCFAYCAMFPKNYDFEMNELVSLWIAEGFVCPAKNMRMEVEDLGNDYFKNLHWRSFFQFSSVSVRGQKMYKMHDLIHSMAQLISTRTCLHLNDSQPNEDHTFFKNTRHISLDCPNQQPRALEGYLWYENLRTLKVISEYVGNIEVPYDLFLKLKFLRVLDLSRLGLVELPESIEHLKHLRYLNLSENDFIKLPESLTSLFSLQILKLEKCAKLRDLPEDMKKMVGLKHLYFDIKQLDDMPPEFGKLVNLQSLSAFLVGRTIGCGIGELKDMKFLRGSLCIKNLENVQTVNEAKEAMLHTKPFLDRLELEWSDFGAQHHHRRILSGLQPHENLKELAITNYSGELLPTWFVSPLCKLSSISLHCCRERHVLSSLAKLQNLKSLLIEDMSSWDQVDQDFSGFPSLESLVVKGNSELISWGVFRGSRFPRLLTLLIEDCPMLTNLPSLVGTSCLHSLKIDRCPELHSLPDDGLPRSLEELTISDCDFLTNRCRVQQGADWDKIRSIRKIEIDYVEIPLDMRRL